MLFYTLSRKGDSLAYVTFTSTSHNDHNNPTTDDDRLPKIMRGTTLTIVHAATKDPAHPESTKAPAARFTSVRAGEGRFRNRQSTMGGEDDDGRNEGEDASSSSSAAAALAIISLPRGGESGRDTVSPLTSDDTVVVIDDDDSKEDKEKGEKNRNSPW